MPAPEHADEVRATIAALRRSLANNTCDSRRVIAALRKTALILSDAREPVAVALRQELQEETGLSMPMIEWGLVTSLASLRHAPLADLVSAIPADAPREVIGVVLAGNVFVAALRGLALPLLAGAHVIAKTSTREGAFARAFRAALLEADPEVGARLAIVQFSREDKLATQALCTGVDALSVYGADQTIDELRQICANVQHLAAISSTPTSHAHERAAEAATPPPADGSATERAANSASDPNPRIIAHGHGVSAAFVARSVLSSLEQAARAAERVALDVAVYDQHGCLSPHFVLVESGGAVEPQAFARLLADQALPALAEILPAAQPTLQERAEQMQWQAIAAVRGELFAHSAHGVSYELAPLRPSPGGRQISVYACADQDELQRLLAPFAEHLKCLGVAGTKAERSAVTERVQRFCSAQVCRSGEMQSPPFDAWADGAPPLDGLFRVPTR